MQKLRKLDFFERSSVPCFETLQELSDAVRQAEEHALEQQTKDANAQQNLDLSRGIVDISQYLNESGNNAGEVEGNWNDFPILEREWE
jgi:hypothetical protein